MNFGKSPRIAIESVPPLASIDETDDDMLSGTSPRNVSFIPSSCNKNLVILTNSATSTVTAVPPQTEPQCPSRSSVFSPESDDFGCLTVTAAEEELADTGFFSSSISCSSKRSSIDSTSLPVGQFSATLGLQCQQREEEEDEDQLMDDFFDSHHNSMPKSMSRFTVASTPGDDPSTPAVLGSQSPDLSTSLEDLVNCFDDKVKGCLVNYQENVSTLAPVQMRSPEEYIRERPAWCTLTGNCGNILLGEWSKMSPEGCHHRTEVTSSGCGNECTSNLLLDDAVEEEARLKHLIDVCLEMDHNTEPIRTAEDILEEISNLFPLGSDLPSLSPEHSLTLTDMPIRRMSFYRFSLEKLKNLSLDQLQDLNEDLETKVQRHSEVLVKQLARRDELEFEKEQKNAFISLMLSLQNRRKVYFQEVQSKSSQEQSTPTGARRKLRYLTTIIPYNSGQAADNVPVLQVLIKILKAMLDDSPTVPTLLTDYILTHICPSESYGSSDINSPSSSSSEQSTYLRSALRSLARSSQHSLGSVSAANANTAFAQLTATFNSKLKAAARRSFSFTAGRGATAGTSAGGGGHSGSHCGTVLNNNPDASSSRKNSLSGAVQTYDACNAIVA